jgi:hypothetical protein
VLFVVTFAEMFGSSDCTFVLNPVPVFFVFI